MNDVAARIGEISLNLSFLISAPIMARIIKEPCHPGNVVSNPSTQSSPYLFKMGQECFQEILQERLNVLLSTLSWLGFKETLTEVFKAVWKRHDEQPKRALCGENGAATSSLHTVAPTSQEPAFNVIDGLQKISDKRCTGGDLEVILCLLVQGVATLDGLGESWLNIRFEDLPNLDTNDTVDIHLEQYLRSRRQSYEDLQLLAPPSPLRGDCVETRSNCAWLREEVAYFLKERTRAFQVKELVKRADQQTRSDLFQRLVELGRHPQRSPKDTLARLGLTDAELNNPKAEYTRILAAIAFCDMIQDETTQTQSGSSWALRAISPSITGAILDQVKKSLCQRAAKLESVEEAVERELQRVDKVHQALLKSPPQQGFEDESFKKLEDKCKEVKRECDALLAAVDRYHGPTLWEFKILSNCDASNCWKPPLIRSFWRKTDGTSQLWDDVLLTQVRNVLACFNLHSQRRNGRVGGGSAVSAGPVARSCPQPRPAQVGRPLSFQIRLSYKHVESNYHGSEELS